MGYRSGQLGRLERELREAVLLLIGEKQNEDRNEIEEISVLESVYIVYQTDPSAHRVCITGQ